MPKVTYITPEGAEKEIDLRLGQSVMEGAIRNGLPGILAECGGSCMCATCHVYILNSDKESLPPMSDDEDAMLDESTAERRENSRLSCQIRMTDELDGLKIQIAENL